MARYRSTCWRTFWRGCHSRASSSSARSANNGMHSRTPRASLQFVRGCLPRSKHGFCSAGTAKSASHSTPMSASGTASLLISTSPCVVWWPLRFGLVCGRQRDDRLVVCNPMSKAWTVLPPKRHRWKYPIVGMVMDRESGGYTLVVAGSHKASGKSLTTEVYNSTTKSWKLIGTQPFQYRFQTNAVHFHGSLYTAVDINLAGFHAILAYNLEQEQWTEVPGPALAEHTQLMVPQICKCRGCLLLVEVVTERFLITRVSLWVLRHPGDPWTNIASMPPPLLQEIVTLSGSRLLTYYGHGDLVLFTFARQSVLAYNLAQSTWEWMPRCPFIRGFARRVATFAYSPRLCASCN